MAADPAHRGGALDPGQGTLTDTIYLHLRAIAQQQMNSERPGHSLSATALVHEAYLRLEGRDQPAQRRAEFLLAAAEAMRRILIEHARKRGRIKRGGGKVRCSLETIGDVVDLDRVAGDDAEIFLAFEEAFGRLQGHEPRAADVARLRFFAGLSVPETARALGVSERTVNNRWSYARAWLARALSAAAGAESPGEIDPHARREPG